MEEILNSMKNSKQVLNKRKIYHFSLWIFNIQQISVIPKLTCTFNLNIIILQEDFLEANKLIVNFIWKNSLGEIRQIQP